MTEAAKQRIDPEKLKELRVLYVEDEPDVREELAEILEMELLTVYVAKNGEEGLELFQKHKPDVVVTDIQMPVMDGLKMGRAIRELDYDVPIIITTAFNEPSYLIEAIDMGVDKYVTKPIKPDLLIQAIYRSAQALFHRREVEVRNRFIQFILDANPSFMVTTTSEDVEYINKTFLNFLGYQSLEEFVREKKSIEDYLVQLDESRMHTHRGEWIQYMIHHPDTEHIVYLKDCNDPECRGRAYIVGYSRFPEMERFVFTFTDIDRLHTEKEAFKEKARQSNEEEVRMRQLMALQSRQAEMGEMISSITHQWRQPLNSLGLLIQDLQDAYNYNELDSSYLEKMTRNGMEQINYMSKTIDDFRNFFKPDKERQLFDSRRAVESVVEMLGDQYTRNQMEVTLEGEESLQVKGFPNEFRQVILNLLNNSRDAFSEQNRENQRIIIRFARESDSVVITVSDNAGGIPSDLIHRIFDPYITTKSDEKGTGIGLYMARTIIETNMGGKLEVKNEKDGATFTIRLPLTETRN